jgi:hypothetical protein
MTRTIINECLAGSYRSDFQGLDRTYSYTLQVETDVPGDDGIAIRFGTVGMPVENQTTYQLGNSTDVSAICRQVSPRALGAGLWNVDVTFSSKPIGSSRKGDPQQQIENPLLRPPVVSTRTIKKEYVMQYDLDNKPFINSALQAYEPEQCKRNCSLRSLTVQVNLPFADFATWDNLLDCVNASPFYGNAPDTVYFDEANHTGKWEGAWYAECTFSFLIHRLGWNSAVVSGLLDCGSWTYDSGTGKITYFTDSNGIASTEKRLLNGAGGELIKGNTPIVNSFRKFYQRNFSLLGIGS